MMKNYRTGYANHAGGKMHFRVVELDGSYSCELRTC